MFISVCITADWADTDCLYIRNQYDPYSSSQTSHFTVSLPESVYSFVCDSVCWFKWLKFPWRGFSCIPGSYIENFFGIGLKTEMFYDNLKKTKTKLCTYTKLSTQISNWNETIVYTQQECVYPRQIKNNAQSTVTQQRFMVSEWFGMREGRWKHHALLPDFRTMVWVYNGGGRTEEIERQQIRNAEAVWSRFHVCGCTVLSEAFTLFISRKMQIY